MSDRYTVLVVDPPWSYGSATGRTRTAEHHYPTMGRDGKEINRKTGAGVETIIMQTPVVDLADLNSHLYLWTTNPKLPFAFAVMEAWGFDYKTTLTWVKTTRSGAVHGGGMGWFFRGATEHVLFGVRGHKPIPSALRKPNLVMAETGGHSEKPVAFYDLLRGIYPEGERMIDIYARRRHSRFEAWGNQVACLDPNCIGGVVDSGGVTPQGTSITLPCAPCEDATDLFNYHPMSRHGGVVNE